MNKRGTKSIHEKAAAEQSAYKRLLKQTEAKVVRREYWDCLDSRFPWHWNPSKYCLCLIEGPRGRPKPVSKSDGSYHEYGFDSSGRRILIRTVCFNKLRKEHFIRYSGDRFIASMFGHFDQHGIRLEMYGEGLLEDDRTVELEKAETGTTPWMEVTWDGEQPVRLLFASARGDKPRYEWLFTKGGRLIGMYELPRKLPKGTNLMSLTKTIRERLMAVIPTTVAKAKVKQPAYCLILGYDGEGNGPMPPSLSIGLDSERQQFIKEDRKTAKARIWSPDEFQHRLSKPRDLSDDTKLQKASEWYNRVLADKQTNAPGRELLNRVAADLARLDWSKHLPVTEDFAVIAVDYECGDLAKNAKASIPSPLLKRLKSQGLL